MNKQQQHTPGPWKTAKYNGISQQLLGQMGAMRIVFANADVAYVPSTDDDSGNANARLIAAAPELLDAVETLLDNGGSTNGEWCPLWAIRRARAAIAKATGQGL